MQKKMFTAIICASCFLSLLSSPVYAEESSKTEYTFRGIPWYSTKSEVEQIFENDGFTIYTDSWKNMVRRLSGIDFISTMSGNDYVEGGGYVGRYYGVDVAGYDVSRMGACYVYTIDDSGNINKSDDDALFYFGWYEFDSTDYVDGKSVYEDLSNKLTALYGNGISDDESDYHSTITWTDSFDNQIRLLLGGKSGEKHQYVTLGYIAADADARLDEMQEALDAEQAASEAAEREKNADNTSGL